MLNEKTKIVGLVYISNVLGAIAPVQQISEAAHKVTTCTIEHLALEALRICICQVTEIFVLSI